MVVQFFQCPGNPGEQAGLDVAPVDLVQHLVPTARIKIEGDIAQPGIAVAGNQFVARSCCPTGSSLPENK